MQAKQKAKKKSRLSLRERLDQRKARKRARAEAVEQEKQARREDKELSIEELACRQLRGDGPKSDGVYTIEDGLGRLRARHWTRWSDYVLQFCEEVRPAEKESATQALLLVTDLLPGEALPPWSDMSWARIMTTHVYTNHWGPRYAQPASLLSLAGRFFTWVHKQGEFDETALSDILDEIDEQREAHGIRRRREPSGRRMSHFELPFAVRAFVRDHAAAIEDPVLRENEELILGGIGHALSFLDDMGRPGRFDALDPDAYATHLIEEGAHRSLQAAVSLLRLVAAFVLYLAPDHVETGRAHRIAEGLRHWSARLAMKAA